MTIATEDMKYLCDLIKKRSGISLGDDKTYLLDSRLLPLVRRHGMKDIAKLVSTVKLSNDEKIITEIIEAVTTNETSFFRDIKPFDQFRDVVLPHVLANNKEKEIRIWCSACSTGQEPYSLSMILLEKKAGLNNSKVDIRATDIDKSVIKKAEEGLYTQFEVQRGLPIALLMKYFRQEKSYGDKWKIKDEVKAQIKYNHLNLLDHYDSMGKFDVIFCRNVLIYFEPDIKTAVLEKLAKCLKPHGLLFLGAAETITGLTDKLKIFGEHRSLYCLSK